MAPSLIITDYLLQLSKIIKIVRNKIAEIMNKTGLMNKRSKET